MSTIRITDLVVGLLKIYQYCSSHFFGWTRCCRLYI